MNVIGTAVRQPVTVLVGVILILLAGFIAIQRLPIQLTPDVEDTIIAVTTRWEGASPQEIEQEIVDEQEDKLQGIANLRAMTSTSQQGVGTVRLEFQTGTPKEHALREVSDKLREVPEYPANADEPVVEASDPENRDYIAWIVLETTDPDLDVRTLQDFAEDRIKPVLERIDGMSEVNALGGREREVQVRFDPVRLAQHGITIPELVSAIRLTNQNTSAGAVEEQKSDVRVRVVSQYESVAGVERTVVAQTSSGPVLLSDVADVVETFKEPISFVHSRGRPVVAINAQKEVGANVMRVMADLKAALAKLNAPGGLLESEARERGLDGELRLTQVYDQTVYIDDALALVKDNIWLGGALAFGVLMLFLRSLRPAAVIALAIPISVIGGVVVMVALGRSVNVISLAGMAFAVGMVVDNSIVVLENIYRHLEMGKRPFRAAVDGAREVYGAVLASTLTTVVVFVPILLIEEEAGQLFRDIALAIVASVSLSLIVAVTVIPSSAARMLRESKPTPETAPARPGLLSRIGRRVGAFPDAVANLVWWMCGSTSMRVLVVSGLTAVSVVGTWLLMPPADYLPQGNRNLVFGLLIPPPGYNLDQLGTLAKRIESEIEPFWEAAAAEDVEQAARDLPAVPTFDFATMSPGEPVVPPPVDNYFIVSFEGIMFHGGVATDPKRAVDLQPLFQHGTRPEVAPGVLAFAFQVPLFRLGGSTGSAVKINFSGDDLDQVSRAALAVYLDMIGTYGPASVQPDPSNFNVPGPELRVRPNDIRLGEAGFRAADIGTIVQALGDGAIIGDYRIGGQTVDLKLQAAQERRRLADIGETPLATPLAGVVPLSSLADVARVNAASQINREGRQRAVTLQFTAPTGLALEEAVVQVDELLRQKREQGVIPPAVATSFTGSASKLAAVQSAMLGDGTFTGTLTSSLVLALIVVYLLMCVLFQSFLYPLIILFNVPLATLGGFAALYGVSVWSRSDRYLPIQNLDVLTMLGFVILIGIVVNNAILIVHQTFNFMRGEVDGQDDEIGEALPPREAIRESVRSRVRPIFMSTFTSTGGMLPLVLMPGSGSELYRGLGAVVIGGLLVSTVFTLLLVPSLLSLVLERQVKRRARREARSEPERVERPRRVPAGTASLVLLVALLGGLAGCASAARRPTVPVEVMVERIALAYLETLGSEHGPPRVPEQPDTGVREAVQGSLEELERMGDPQALPAEPEVGRDLLGDPQEIAAIDLASAVASAAEHNLGVRLAHIQPALDSEGVLIEEADFDTVVFASFDYLEADTPGQVPVLGGVVLGRPVTVTRDGILEGGVRRMLPSGADVSLSTFVERFENRTAGIEFLPNPAWQSGLAAQVTQPLLRGFGAVEEEAEIELARNRERRSEHQLEAELLLVAATVEQAYWDLQESWSRLAILEELTRAGEEVERVLSARRTFDAGPPEISDALATVEQRRADLVRGRRLVRAASDQLKALLDDPAMPVGSELLLRPTDPLPEEPAAWHLREAVAEALRERPEIRQAITEIEDARLRDLIARDGIRPLFDVSAGVSLAGLEEDLDDAWASVAEDDLVSWFVGFDFELPVGNRAARAELRAARLAERASLLRFEQAVKAVVLEVKAALRDLETAYALIGAARSFRIAQTENLRALLAEEEARRELTPEFLNLKFRRQEGLAQAQIEEMEALASYNRAIAAFHRSIGTALRARNVEFEPTPPSDM